MYDVENLRGREKISYFGIPVSTSLLTIPMFFPSFNIGFNKVGALETEKELVPFIILRAIIASRTFLYPTETVVQ